MDPKIEHLHSQNIYLGTSSWKYPGWAGIVYKKSYPTAKAFNETCLAEYAQTYTAVGVDHTYYAWPLASTIQKYTEQTPSSFRFGLKVTEKITVFKYPNLKRYGKDAGSVNSSFLSAKELKENFLKPLEKFADRLGPLMLEFSQFYPGMVASGAEFISRLDRFFQELRDCEPFRFAIELRNANWLKRPYFETLARHGVGHVFNSWTRMPPIIDQLHLAGDVPLPFFIGRILLQPGTSYEQAVEAFSPYDRLQDPHPELRGGAVALIRGALESGVPAYVFVNNRAEGCAPKTIQGILDLL